MGQADPILDRLGAGPASRKLVETAITLSHSSDPQQRNHAYSFMESAIKELEDDEDKEDSKLYKKMHEEEDDDKRDHKLHEEELKNHNTGSRDEGSEQSTDNTEPYPGTGKDSDNGEKPMQDMSGTENQMSETGMIVPGLAPDVAQEMGHDMPQMPPMNTPQMMKQMAYTVNEALKKYHETVMQPFARTMNNKIKETGKRNSVTELDLDHLKDNATARFRETVPTETFTPRIDVRPHKKNDLVEARNEITQMNKVLNSENNNIYG